jgi:hypothetical protein
LSLSIQTEDYIVFLAETSVHSFEPEKARQAIKRDVNIRRSHLFPILEAVAHFACSHLLAPQGCAAFELPRSPWIIVVGDDMHFSWGPQAFPEDSLNAAIKAAGHFIIVSSGPELLPYQAAATVAARDRGNALLIETLPHQEGAWLSRIEKLRGANAPMVRCVPFPAEGEQ